MNPPQIVVVGGGYAGTMAANRLTRRDDVDITLINPRTTFVERIRLHQFTTRSHPAIRPYADVLAGRVRFLTDTVDRIDAAQRQVHLTSGARAGYDYLIYATGSTGTTVDVPGAAKFAHSIATLEQAQRLRSALESVPPAGAVTVVGAGPTGIETAAELAEAGFSLTLVSGEQLGPYLHPRARRSVANRLAGLGVRVLSGADHAVTAVHDDGVHLADGSAISSEVTIWTGGFEAPRLAARSALRTDSLGRLLTDETLTSLDDERIIGAGDAAAPSGLPYRMSCQAAVQMGPLAAETVLARIAGTEPSPAGLGFFALCLSLGRKDGLLQVARRDDTAAPVHIAGRAGAALKELICKSTITQLRSEARRPGLLSAPGWAKDGKRRRWVQAAAGHDAAHR